MSQDRPFVVSASELLLDLGFLRVVKRFVQAPDGKPFRRYVVEHPGAAAVVPMVGSSVVLLRQYRAPIQSRILEIPAGKLDLEGESIQDAVRRELTEETGYIAGDLVHLTDMWTAVGFSDERISIYLAESLYGGPSTPIGPEERDAEVILMSLDEAINLIEQGEIADSKTVAGLLLADRVRSAS